MPVSTEAEENSRSTEGDGNHCKVSHADETTQIIRVRHMADL